MSKMGAMVFDIQEQLAESGGNPDFKAIAKRVGVPIDWVRQAYAEMGGYAEPDFEAYEEYVEYYDDSQKI